MSSEINQIHKSLFVTSNDNFEDIEDEQVQNMGTLSKDIDTNEISDINPVYTSDEGLSLIQASKDYTDAIQSLAANSWDTSSWNIFIEEVEHGRGGATTLEEAYLKYLDKFPLSAKVQKKLIDFYIRTKLKSENLSTTQSNQDIDYKYIENMYNKCLNACRNVTLYHDYLTFMKFHMLDKTYDTAVSSKKGDMAYSLARSNYEVLIEKALESIGMAMDSNIVWKLYIEFINNYPELGIADSSGRKTTNLRKIYQRAICIPMNELDSFWRDYEALEKSAGEHLAERVLPEFREKYMHAKAIFKERQRITSSLVFDKLAIPPTQLPATLNSSATCTTGSSVSSGANSTALAITMNLFQFETQQIDIWTQWLKYEIANPDNLPLEGLKAMLTYVYKKCLCCFRFHPEIWLAFAHFEYSIDSSISNAKNKGKDSDNDTSVSAEAVAGGKSSVVGLTCSVTQEAKSILMTAIETLPNIATLRVALAEYEEQTFYLTIAKQFPPVIAAAGGSGGSGSGSSNASNQPPPQQQLVSEGVFGNLLIAKSILREAFEEFPSTFSFSALQKFIRKHEGMNAARRLFSESYRLRSEKKLGCEIYMAHALMEFEVNSQAQVAIKVMQLALTDDRTAIANIHFVRLFIRILLSQGSISDIRWLCFVALGRDPTNIVALNAAEIGNQMYMTDPAIASTLDPSNTITSYLETYAKNEDSLPLPAIANPIYRYHVWCDLYHAESTLSQCNVLKLDMIRKYKNDAKKVMDDHTQLRVYNTKNKDKSAGTSQVSTSIYGTNNDLNYFSNISDTIKNLYDKYPVLSLSDTSPDILLKTRVLIQTQIINNENSIDNDVGDSIDSATMNETINFYNMNTRRQQQQQQQRGGGGGMKSALSQYQPPTSSDRGAVDGSSGVAVNVSYDALNQVLSLMPDDFTAKYTNTTVLLKDFLSKLPVYNGPPFQTSDIDQFVHHFKNIILPPRPIDMVESYSDAVASGGSAAVQQAMQPAHQIKRSRLFQEESTGAGAGGFVSGGGQQAASDFMDEDDYDEAAAITAGMNGDSMGMGGGKRDDVFKQRRRQKRGRT